MNPDNRCTTVPYSHLLVYFHSASVGGITIGGGHSFGDHVFQSCWGSRLHDFHLLLYLCSYIIAATFVVVQELILA